MGSLRLLAVSILVTAFVASAATPRPARFAAVMHKATFEKQGTYPIRFDAKGDHHPALKTGTRDTNGFAIDHTSIHLTERPRLHPQLIITSTEGGITRAILDYGDEAFSIPKGKLVIKARHSDAIVAEMDFKHLLGVERKAHDIEWPENLRTVSSWPAEMLLEFTFDHQETTTFVYTLENGIPADVYDSSEMYDLTPHNSTMMTKFMIKANKGGAKEKLSVWVSRKAVSPDFTLIVALDGEIFSQANVEHDPKSTDALGYDVEIDKDVGRFLKSRIDFIVHFYEKPRSNLAVARVENLRETLNELKSADKPMTKLTLATDVPNLLLQLQYHQGTNFVGLKVLQPGPMSDVQISLFRVDKDGGRTLFLREGDDVVPFYPKDSSLQYGWDDALPSDVDAVTADGEDLFTSPVDIELWYNGANESGIASDLSRWIVGNGGKVGSLDLSYLDVSKHSYDRKHPLTSKADLESGDIIASIPYALLVAGSTIERGAWSKMLVNSSAKHRAHVEANGVLGDAEKILHLTTVVHLQLFDESMNFRPYFNTFGKSAQKLPPFFTEDEVALFDFDPQVRKEMQRMKALWDVEFETLEDVSAMLPRGFTRQSYFEARSQVETRLLNLTGELVLAPIVDLLTHDDEPNAKVEYNDESHVISILATKHITAGTPITIDLGHREKTGLDFLIQFGFVPPKAIDAATITVPEIGAAYLTSDIDSRDALAQRIASARANGDEDAAEEGIAAAKADVIAAAKTRFAELSKAPAPHHPSSPLAADAERLLKTERDVLSKHIQASESG